MASLIWSATLSGWPMVDGFAREEVTLRHGSSGQGGSLCVWFTAFRDCVAVHRSVNLPVCAVPAQRGERKVNDLRGGLRLEEYGGVLFAGFLGAFHSMKPHDTVAARRRPKTTASRE